MTAYLIATVDVADPTAYAEYAARTPAIVERFGGRFLARGGEVLTLEGEAETRRVVILAFPSRERAEAMYRSDEYQAARALRAEAADARFIVVEGAEGAL